MPDWILPTIAAFAAGWCRGRFKQDASRVEHLTEALMDARRWQRSYEILRDHGRPRDKTTTTPVERHDGTKK